MKDTAIVVIKSNRFDFTRVITCQLSLDLELEQKNFHSLESHVRTI